MQPIKGLESIYVDGIVYLNYIHLVQRRLMADNLCQIFFSINIIMVSGVENGRNSLKVYYANK